MTKFLDLKAKYGNVITASLEKNKNILIESFTQFYGEEFRSIIEERFKEIIFTFFLDLDGIELLLTRHQDKLKSEQIRDLLNLRKGLIKENSILRYIKRRKNVLPPKFVWTSKPDIFNSELANWFSKTLNDIVKPSDLNIIYQQMYRFVFLPIFSLNERAVIHEINHALVFSFLVFLEDKGNIYKAGINSEVAGSFSKEVIMEELLNDKSSFEILEIFKRRGGDLSSFCITNTEEYAYEHNFYLVDRFYEYFKEYIKKSRITENKNILISRLGEEAYKKYISLVNYFYNTNLDIVAKTKEKAIPAISSVVEEMKRNEKNSHNLTVQELETYYEELRNNGYHVAVLNEYHPEDYDVEPPLKR